jgi:hypothetical protein
VQLTVVSIAFLLAAALPPSLHARQQPACPAGADAWVARGYQDYRADRLDAARAAFLEAVRRCPAHMDARIALGNVDLRSGRTAGARTAFDQVLAADSTLIEALVGRGIVAWREGDLREVWRRFTAVQRLEPGNAEAADYLARLPAGVGDAPDRPPLLRPDTLVMTARAAGERFQVRDASGSWREFYVNGINLGAALPGRHPSEFPAADVYRTWIAQMAEMGANTVRLYTIHPPHFYQALLEHNLAHPDAPLWIIQGVWAEPPPRNDFSDPTWQRELFQEMERVVDLLHGRADIAPRPGHASGHFLADVSRWTLAYVTGREWEPFSLLGHNKLHPGDTVHQGVYLSTRSATPSDVWMARASEHMIAYEMDRYHAQRPIAFTSWPTTDPLRHWTESTVAEELALRAARREPVTRRPKEYDNDVVSLDATRTRATPAFPAGWFASFHAYPYYPELMIREPAFQSASSSLGPSNYFGYLSALARHHQGMPVLIAEYGVPASVGIAHLQPQGWHQGGHTESEMAEVDARLTREIAEAGMAGGILFAWIDEWFKKNWVTIEFQLPAERKRFWLDRLDAEQQYGVYATEPVAAVSGQTLADRLRSWQALPALYQDTRGTVRAAADEAYLWLLLEPSQDWSQLFVGFDMLLPDAGDTRWPGGVGDRLPVGIEFALHADVEAGTVRMLAHPPYNPYRIDQVGVGSRGGPLALPGLETAPPGVFSGRVEMVLNRPFEPKPASDGDFEALRIVTNRRRFSRDGVEFAATGYDRGVLRSGPPPDGLWETDGRTIEVRIPWGLLNVTDPSQRRVLARSAAADTSSAPFSTTTVPGIRLVAAARTANGGEGSRSWISWPATGRASDVALFTWPTWEEPRWRTRARPVYEVMRSTWRELAPRVLQETRPR